MLAVTIAADQPRLGKAVVARFAVQPEPAPVVQLVKGASAGIDATVVGAAPPAASAMDQLARSRSAFAIALGVAALGLVLAPLALTALRRWTVPAPPAAPLSTAAAQQPEPSTGRAEPTRGRSPARSGQRRG